MKVATDDGGPNKLMKKVTSVALSVVFLVAIHSFANDAPKANSFKETLRSVPAAELPAKAADLVLHAKSRDRASTTLEVVKAAIAINPGAAPAIVGAIARSVADMASIAAGAAAIEQPQQAAAIAKAAAAAAPSRVRKVVTAVCRAVPKEYRSIALAVAEALPGYAKEIVDGVASALPDLRPAIEQTLMVYKGNVPSVADTLDQAASVAQTRTTANTTAFAGAGTTVANRPTTTPAATTTSGVRGPAVGPPYIPPSNTPTNVTSGTSGKVPAGHRNYAEP